MIITPTGKVGKQMVSISGISEDTLLDDEGGILLSDDGDQLEAD